VWERPTADDPKYTEAPGRAINQEIDTVLYVTNSSQINTQSATPTPRAASPQWRRLAGLAHRMLKSAVVYAVASTKPDWRITSDVVGCDIIDHIHELDGRCLRVLATVFSMLIRLQRSLAERVVP
jgi:hypothetical protein